MRIARLLLALFALVPVSTFVSAQPAMAQANCRWDLDGLWVGVRNGWRVNIKARPGGQVVWADGTPEPGQGVGEYLYRDTGPKLWVFTFPDGVKATMQLDAKGLLQTWAPPGPETFKRVRPAGPPKCVSVEAPAPSLVPAPAASRPAPVKPSAPQQWIAATKASSSQTASTFDLALAAETRGDFATALRLYEQACGASDGNACTNAGLIHFNGKLGASNFQLAVRFHARGCLMDNSAAACFNQGALSEFGIGTSKDTANAIALYRVALKLKPTPAEWMVIDAGLDRLAPAQRPPDNTGGS